MYSGLEIKFRSIIKGLIGGSFSVCVMTILLLTSLSKYVTGQENLTISFPAEKSVELSNGINMSYYKKGHGNINVLFIHGLGSNKKAWVNLMPLLSEDHTLYAIDLPKYLETDDVSGIGMEAYAECIHLFMNEMNIKSANICGHSMGGQVAMHYVLAHQDRVDNLILLATAGIERFSEEDKKWFETYITKTTFLDQNNEQIKRNFDINFYGSKVPESAAFMLLERLALKNDTLLYGRYIDYIIACISSMLAKPVYTRFSEIMVPTLVVYGENDLLIPNKFLHPSMDVEDLFKEASLIPDVTTLLLPNAGHFVQWDQNILISKNIKQFIQPN